MNAPVRLAVVVPVHRQPQFLAGAAFSALASEVPGAQVGVVIVNDGCPFPSTGAIARELRDGHPERVRYVVQANRGLSAARNAGIAEALRAWPEIEAVFPLDADNRLSPHTLARLRAQLHANPGAGWAYPAVEFFGLGDDVWEVPGGFNPYRQLFENQCDAGALIAREVLDGVTYDETMRDGYEDWEFYLRASLAGYRGVPAGPVGFRYRVRRRSMKAHADVRVEAIYAEIRRRNAAAFAPAALARLEHEALPRFALATPGGPALALACTDLEPVPAEPGATPITALGTPELWSLLRALGLLPGLLLRAQEALRRHPAVALAVARDSEPDAVRLSEVAHPGIEHAWFSALGAAPGPSPALELRIGERLAPALPPPLPPRARSPMDGGDAVNGGPPTHARFSLAKHVDRLETSFPRAGAAGELWLVADEPVAAVSALAQAIAPRAAHLVVTGALGVAGHGDALRAFATLTLLGGVQEPGLLARVLEPAGIVLVAASAIGYAALADLGPGGGPVRVALAGEVERDELGEGRDPFVRVAQDAEDLVDVVLATSRRAAIQFENLEVVPDKLAVVDLADPAGSARVAAEAIREAAAR